MKTSLDHLPVRKQREIERVTRILLEQAEEATAIATGFRRRMRVYKIILFGSYARGGWVDEGPRGYQSDYDILIVVSHQALTDMPRYWWAAEDRIQRDRAIKTPVQVIVHTLGDVNDQLRQGQYFFRDIKEEGIAVYAFEGTKSSGNRRHDLAEPAVLSPAEAHGIARKYFERVLPHGVAFMKGFRTYLNDRDYNHAAFELHQATEFAYRAQVLTHTLYAPRTHHLGKLRGFSEALDRSLVDAWPRGRKPYDRYFELLRRAYTEARYSEHYEITKEALEWLGERVAHLHTLIEASCRGRLAALAAEAGIE